MSRRNRWLSSRVVVQLPIYVSEVGQALLCLTELSFEVALRMDIAAFRVLSTAVRQRPLTCATQSANATSILRASRHGPFFRRPFVGNFVEHQFREAISLGKQSVSLSVAHA